jgi:hypothetical protein
MAPPAPFPLTDETRTRIRALFPPEEQPQVERMLIERCGTNLPLVDDWPAHVERNRYAVLKLSGGSLPELARHVAVACTDWRDVLVAAGFGHDPGAHRSWNP